MKENLKLLETIKKHIINMLIKIRIKISKIIIDTILLIKLILTRIIVQLVHVGVLEKLGPVV